MPKTISVTVSADAPVENTPSACAFSISARNVSWYRRRSARIAASRSSSRRYISRTNTAVSSARAAVVSMRFVIIARTVSAGGIRRDRISPRSASCAEISPW